MSHIPVPPAGRLGDIQYNPTNNTYETDKNRPDFLNHVYAVLPGNTAPHCHSYSFIAIQNCLLNLLQRYGMTQMFCHWLSSFVNIFLPLESPLYQSLLTTAYTTFQNAVNTYSGAPSVTTHSCALVQLNNLLARLNSVTGNLRLPANASLARSWNTSIREKYDIGLWFYVENGLVQYDYTGPLTGIPARQYLNNNPTLQPLPVPNDGFCVYSQQDCYLLPALMAFNRSLGSTLAPIQFYSALDNHSAFLYSSNNQFPIPLNCVPVRHSIRIPVQYQLPFSPPAWCWQTL